ncbi:TPA: hydrolase TatD [Candidatus Gastranaerophilales bacterium HUM_9]|nr:MAG TPA: hydrolase TatD [Candidatus Gastranaerophilales bacterium HUM_9]HBX35423.1 hydrolase TatD [Cyanobacteria bacterium UBA11440]
MSYLIDTHAHLDMYEDWDVIIKNAKENGIKKIIIPAVETEYFQKILDIANSYEDVYCMMGIFPTEAKNWHDGILDDIREFAKNKKVVSIGEIGLDYYWDKSFVDEQKDIFIKQVKLANELGLPIEIHDREAHKDVFDILVEYNKTSDVVFHCFSGSVEFARECLKQGWYIALGGVVTFKNAVKTKEVAKDVPLDRLMLETDSPYLTPVPFRGKENQPAYVRYVADEIAKLKGIDVKEVIEATTKNAEMVFGI